MMKKNIILVIFMLLSAHLSRADSTQVFDVKALKDAGKINSLEYILDELSSYNINRLLEIKLKHRAFQGGAFQDDPRPLNHQFIYEIEYINDKGIVLEIEVDALTAEVLNHEREY